MKPLWRAWLASGCLSPRLPWGKGMWNFLEAACLGTGGKVQVYQWQRQSHTLRKGLQPCWRGPLRHPTHSMGDQCQVPTGATSSHRSFSRWPTGTPQVLLTGQLPEAEAPRRSACGGCWGWSMTVPTPQDPAREDGAGAVSRGLRGTGASMGLRGRMCWERWMLRWDCGHDGLRGTGASMELWAWRAETNRRLSRASRTRSDRAGHRQRRLPGSRQGWRGRRRRERQQPATGAEGGAGRAPRVRRAVPGRAGPGEVTARGTVRAGSSRGDAGRWGEGVPPPRSRRPGLSRVNRCSPAGESRLSPLPCPVRTSHLPAAEVLRPAGTGCCAAGVQEPHCRPRDREGGWGGAWHRGCLWARAGSDSPACVCLGGEGAVPASPAGGSPAPVPSSQASGWGRGSLPGPCGSWSGERDACLGCDWWEHRIMLVVVFVRLREIA